MTARPKPKRIGRPPNPPGRPSKLTPEAQETFLSAMKAGMWVEQACDLAGISRQTVYDWIKRGRLSKTGKHHDFVQALNKTLAEWEFDMLAMIDKVAESGVFAAAAWRLERRFQDRYALRHRIDGNVQVQHQLMIDDSKLDYDELVELRRLLLKCAPDPAVLEKNERSALELVAGSDDVVEGELVAESA